MNEETLLSSDTELYSRHATRSFKVLLTWGVDYGKAISFQKLINSNSLICILALRQAVDSLTQMTQEQSIFVVRGRDKIGISPPADIRVSSVSAAENQSVDFKSQILMIIVSQMMVAVKFGDA